MEINQTINGRREGLWIVKYGEKTMEELNYKGGVFHGLCKYWYVNGQLGIEKTYEEGVEHGRYRMWYENGAPRKKGSKVHGKEDGLIVSWYKNSSLFEECTKKNGVMDGMYYGWHSNGQFSARGMYEDGLRTGCWEECPDSRGTIFTITHFVKGVKHGERRSRSLLDNSKSESNYVDGKLSGLYRSWHDDVNLDTEGFYENDQRTGIWKEWHRNGRLRKESTYVAPGVIGTDKYWCDEGRLVLERFPDMTYTRFNWFEDGSLQMEETQNRRRKWYRGTGTLEFDAGLDEDGLTSGPYTEWNSRGEIVAQGEYDKGLKVGNWKLWNREAREMQTGSYERDLKTGPWKTVFYSEDGEQVVIETISYLEGQEDGEFVQYHRNGKPKTQGNYLVGMKHGDWSEWYENGVLKIHIDYWYGTPHVKEVAAISKPTMHPCMVYKDLIPSGSKYLQCSFSEEHVVEYAFMERFMRFSNLKDGRCVYCQNPLLEGAFLQP